MERKLMSHKAKRPMPASTKLLVNVIIVTSLITAYQAVTYSYLLRRVNNAEGRIRRLRRNTKLRNQKQAVQKLNWTNTSENKEDEDGQAVDVATDAQKTEVVEQTDALEEKAFALRQSLEKTPAHRWSWDDDSNYEVNNLWHGRQITQTTAESIDPRKLVLHAVLSHCLGDLGWLQGYIAGFKFQSFTVVSKCGLLPNTSLFPVGASLLQMENVGRNDHTFAHWMTQFNTDERSRSNDIILFLKDNINVHADANMRSLATIIINTVADGFACALEPKTGKSFFHLTDVLSTFYMENYTGVTGGKNSPQDDPHDVLFKSKYENMGAWLRDMGISLPKPLTPVCYGGNFGVKRSQIDKVPKQIWQNMEVSLSRGDNIEEGHFAERTWAGLLYRSLTDHEKELLFQRTKNLAHKNEEMRGALMKE